MKLFRRIFLQALLAVVIISQATLIYFLYEAQQQTVNDWRKNEQTEYTNKLREMDRRLESTGLIFHTGNTETDVIRLELINVFGRFLEATGLCFIRGNVLIIPALMNLIIKNCGKIRTKDQRETVFLYRK